MGYGYDLVCLDCREAFHLGKTHCKDENYQEVGWQFSGIRIDGGGRLEKGALFATIARFLLLHRCHEIRVLPEHTTIYDVDPDMKLKDIGEDIPLTEFLARPVAPEPDPEAEWKQIPKDVVEYMHRKINEDPPPRVPPE